MSAASSSCLFILQATRVFVERCEKEAVKQIPVDFSFTFGQLLFLRSTERVWYNHRTRNERRASRKCNNFVSVLLSVLLSCGYKRAVLAAPSSFVRWGSRLASTHGIRTMIVCAHCASNELSVVVKVEREPCWAAYLSISVLRLSRIFMASTSASPSFDRRGALRSNTRFVGVFWHPRGHAE